MIDDSLVPAIWGFVVDQERQGSGNDTLATEIRDSMRRLEERVANLERAVTTSDSERKLSL